MPAAPVNQQNKNKVIFGQLPKRTARRILIYGDGGIGKTTLACLSPGPVAFFDFDNSLVTLRDELDGNKIDVPIPVPANSWEEMNDALEASGWDKIKTIVIDSVTRAEEMCIADLLRTQKTFDNPPQKADTLEDYGYGKDVRLVYEHFLPFINNLERHWIAGRNIILVAHVCKPEEVNPMGANYMRFEPRLRTSKKGENSIRLYLKEWCDFVGFIRQDIAEVTEKGGKKSNKAINTSGSRTMYLEEQPPFMAKNRGFSGPVFIRKYKSPWDGILK